MQTGPGIYGPGPIVDSAGLHADQPQYTAPALCRRPGRAGVRDAETWRGGRAGQVLKPVFHFVHPTSHGVALSFSRHQAAAAATGSKWQLYNTVAPPSAPPSLPPRRPRLLCSPSSQRISPDAVPCPFLLACISLWSIVSRSAHAQAMRPPHRVHMLHYQGSSTSASGESVLSAVGVWLRGCR
jgi:hypothetical protein